MPARASASKAPAATVDALMRTLEHPKKAEIEAVRRIILAANPRIAEGVKWNAPSFRTDEWFATINLHAKGFVQIVLHLGAKVKAGATVRESIADPERMLEWLGADRATVKLQAAADVAAKRDALTRIVQQWIAAA